jgi:hypothetical protein
VQIIFRAMLGVAIAAGIDLPNPLTLAEVTRAAMANNPELAAPEAG